MLKNNALKKIAFGFLLSTTLVSASNFERKEEIYYPSNEYGEYSSTSREEEYRPSQEEEQFTPFSLESMESFLNNWNKEYKETLDDTSGFSERASGLLNRYGEFLSSFIKYNGIIREQVSPEEFLKIFVGLCGKNDPAVLAKFLLALHPNEFISFASENNSWLLGQFIADVFKALPKNEETKALSLNILGFWSEFLHNKEYENGKENERFQEMEGQIDILEQEKESLERGRKVLLEQLEAEKDRWESYQYAAEVAERRASEYEQEVNKLNEQISSLESELGFNKNNIESLEAELRGYKEQHKGICGTLAEKEAELIELYEKDVESIKEIDKLRKKVDTQESVKDSLREEILRKNTTIQDQRQIIANYQNAIGKSAFELLMQEKDKTVDRDLNDKIEELKVRKAELEQEIGGLKESKNLAEINNEKLKESLKELQIEKEGLERNQTNLINQSRELEAKSDAQQQEIERLLCEKNNSDLRIKKLEGEVLHLNHELDKKSAESSYRQELEKIFKAMNELKQDQSEGFESIRSSGSKIYIQEQNEEEIERSQAQLETRENRLSDLESKLEQSENRNEVLESMVKKLEIDNSTKEAKIGLIESKYAKELEEKNKEIEALNFAKNRLEEAGRTTQSELDELMAALGRAKQLNKNLIDKLKQHENAEKSAEKVEVKEEVPAELNVEGFEPAENQEVPVE